MTYLTNVEDKLNELLIKIDNIEIKMDKIINQNDKISSETCRMDSHVSFVEDIYDKVKNPFHFTMNTISKITRLNTFNYLTDYKKIK
jgi:hypothetical protein